MRRVIHFLINNVREHLMLYIIFWLILAALDVIYLLMR
ncbi:YceO family protein [Siccibacter turicensis]|nr:YceO family protein [Siccibacter turicensis]MDY0971168.1 YceO family protein [Siccibacter turicensis]